MKKVLIILLFVFSCPIFASVNLTGGQGYGTFRLAGAGDTKAGSIIYAGIRFNRYVEFKYLSLGTSIRMPVLPFRLVDVNYNKRTEGGYTKYTSYDSDVFGFNFSLPINRFWSVSALYGLGSSKITEVTVEGFGSDNLATIHQGLIQVVDIQTTMRFEWGDSFVILPTIGWMIHILDNKSIYANAASLYAAVTVSYMLTK